MSDGGANLGRAASGGTRRQRLGAGQRTSVRVAGWLITETLDDQARVQRCNTDIALLCCCLSGRGRRRRPGLKWGPAGCGVRTDTSNLHMTQPERTFGARALLRWPDFTRVIGRRRAGGQEKGQETQRGVRVGCWRSNFPSQHCPSDERAASADLLNEGVLQEQVPYSHPPVRVTTIQGPGHRHRRAWPVGSGG